ncbi:hypothetical protein Bbelb_260010 [Branchiostoma belcheri]|nr:hypothetical protein Bbelb_260010 [Branchiostoma belcheri]
MKPLTTRNCEHDSRQLAWLTKSPILRNKTAGTSVRFQNGCKVHKRAVKADHYCSQAIYAYTHWSAVAAAQCPGTESAWRLCFPNAVADLATYKQLHFDPYYEKTLPVLPS